MRTASALAGLSLFVADLLAAGSPAAAQPWVAPKGEGAISFAFQNIAVENHLAQKEERSGGNIDTFGLLADVTYGLTDRIAVDFSVPYLSSRYRLVRPDGPPPHAGSNRDDGNYHGTFGDARFALRYNLTRRGAVITPYVGSSVPSHDYVFYAHTAPGMRLREYQVGVYAGKLVEQVPGLFVSARYGYGFAQRALDIKHDRSSLDLEVGYFVSPQWRAFGMAGGQYTHGGVDFPPNGGVKALPLEQQPVHDQIQKVHYLKAGGGMAYSITDSIDVFGSVAGQVTGRNGHQMKRGITVGVSWGFTLRGQQAGDVLSSAAAAARRPARTKTTAGTTSGGRKERTLLRCICQKGGRG